MSVEIEVVGTPPNETAIVYGPRAELVAHSMGDSGTANRHHPIGRCSDTGEILVWQDGAWRGPFDTKAPGSPSAPFAAFAALQAALPAGPSAGVGGTAWYLDAASPIGRYESMWKGAAWSDGYLPSSIALPGSPSAPFASFAAVQAMPTTGLALGVTAKYAEAGKIWEAEYTAAGWVRASTYSPTTVWSNAVKHQELLAMGCVAAWDFDSSSATEFVSKIGRPHRLVSAGSTATTLDTSDGPVSGKSLVLDGSAAYLRLLAEDTGSLCLSGLSGTCTVLALVKKTSINTGGFVAGIWQEDDSDPRRQYGLFVHLPLYGGTNTICGHVSKSGGPSPNLPYSRDYSTNKEWIYPGEWQIIAMTYDGAEARSYLHGRFEAVPEYTEPGAPNGEGLTYAKNPYAFTQGLNNSAVGDFTVGALKLTSGVSNFFTGKIAALAIFADALTQKQINAAATTLLKGSTVPIVWYPFRYQNVSQSSNVALGAVSVARTYYGSTAIDGTAGNDLNALRVTRLTQPDAFLYRSFPGAGTVALWVDSQNLGIPLTSIKSMKILANHSTTVPGTRFCVSIGGAWYAIGTEGHCTTAHASGGDWSSAETLSLTFSPDIIAKRLNFQPGVVLNDAGGDTTLGALSGDVASIGIYITGHSTEVIRFRDLQLFA